MVASGSRSGGRGRRGLDRGAAGGSLGDRRAVDREAKRVGEELAPDIAAGGAADEQQLIGGRVGAPERRHGVGEAPRDALEDRTRDLGGAVMGPQAEEL